MSLKEKVREKFEEARKSGHREEKNLLSVILGDVATAEARSGKELTDADVEKMIRKLLESNNETLAQLRSHQRGDDPQAVVLQREIEFLKALLPQSLDVDAIVKALDPVRAEIVGAKNDGQATGVAMKHIKGQSLCAQGQDVSAAVRKIRGG